MLCMYCKQDMGKPPLTSTAYKLMLCYSCYDKWLRTGGLMVERKTWDNDTTENCTTPDKQKS